MLAQVLTRVALVVALALAVSLVVFVGRERLASLRTEWQPRLRQSAPAFALLVVILGLNRIMRQDGYDISQAYGIHMTEVFYSLEGDFVLLFRSIATPEVTTFFSVAYVYVYAFVLIFPVVAYVALSNTVVLRQLLTAYSLNYVIGLVFYLLVIAYGPRNVMIEGMDATHLYYASPEYIHLTTEVNQNRNVFPSLHTSLSATVAIFAYMTRDQYRAWFPVAVGLATSVIISTMYLGIHWAIDVVAGLVLAVVCVVLAKRLVGRWSLSAVFERVRAGDHTESVSGPDREQGEDGV
ncbi:PA-phosphatase-like phosphoesterase [Natrialba hulunbeirensis JCM 10989]|uniref:PA-phosphatase-like phosphoesterase n=1 Tax=Natrialba hulunbeirensis JCM 10989 TaxID=1227493 RepID=L9ZMS9_9EURY|nr:phosphatase PAP2 family protein [Natrialba hulunbeirensis]ELY87664.1 PA-phosphatase-like phosphoesterase [Natrialba hulunbeirensis JCM 10989]